MIGTRRVRQTTTPKPAPSQESRHPACRLASLPCELWHRRRKRVHRIRDDTGASATSLPRRDRRFAITRPTAPSGHVHTFIHDSKNCSSTCASRSRNDIQYPREVTHVSLSAGSPRTSRGCDNSEVRACARIQASTSSSLLPVARNMEATSHKQRRQRAILSCNDCRRRKLKCDRLSPCNRCIKGGITDSCAYTAEAHDKLPDEAKGRAAKRQRREQSRTYSSSIGQQDASASPSIPQTQTEVTRPLTLPEHQDTRVQTLVSSEVPGVKDQVEFLASSPDLKGVNCSTSFMGMLTGYSFGTHYHGPSSQMSIIAHVRAASGLDDCRDMPGPMEF
jgi:hypothetical protein